MKYLERGYLEKDELPPFPSKELLMKRPIAYIECPQPIPKVNYEKCTGCMKCIRVCPGLAIFMLRLRDGKGEVTLQYEFLPVPKKGDKVKLLNRKGEVVGEGVVTWVLPPERNDQTALVRVEMDPELIYDVRAIRVIK